jgi:hypothetical protein
VLVTGLMLPHYSAGWVVAGALFLLAGLLMTRLGRRVEKASTTADGAATTV